jgi:hypothetical protein
MEPANEPAPSDRLEPCPRGSSARSCVQATVRHAQEIARYAAAQLEESRSEITPPDPVLVERLLAISGSVLIRSVETQVWAGFLEMGVCVDSQGRERPCETTLLYDRPSGTWHMEP